MSLLNNSNAISTGGDYNLENSLRFRSSASAYLSRTPATAGNRKTWTFSCWVKRALLGDDITNYQNIIGAQSSNVNNTPWTAIQIDQTNRVRIFYEDLGVTSNFQVITNPRLRDPSSWYHIVVQLDTTQATDSDRIKIYINGEHQTSLFYTNYPTLNEESSFNNNVEHLISYYKFQALNVYSDQYVTEVNFVDGQALTASDFGEYNEDTGVWQPIKYTGTYGTNGFYLKGRGTDNSGNGNNWTETNFNTTNSALTTYDIMTDVPTLTDEDTANFCMISPIDYRANVVAPQLSNANLTFKQTSGVASSIGCATFGVSSGKWYWEATYNVVGGGGSFIGWVRDQISNQTPNDLGYVSNEYAYVSTSGNKYNAASFGAYGASYANGDVIGLALDMDAGTMTFYKNNVSQGTAYSSLPSGNYKPAFDVYNSNSFDANFGQRPFAYTPPAGYKKLNTFNLPDSSIVDGSENFVTAVYTGNGVARSIDNTITDGSNPQIETGDPIQFQPDLVWKKNRATSDNHMLVDSIRGVYYELYSNLTNAQGGDGNGLVSFNSDGFGIGNSSFWNATGNSYVAWNWKAGGAPTTTNTAGVGAIPTAGSVKIDGVNSGSVLAGSIAATSISANTTAGFSVVTYTGTGANATVGHGLGVAPGMVIVKKRTGTIGTGFSNWMVWHNSIGAAQVLYLDTTSAVSTNASTFNSTAPTSSVFSLGTNTVSNENTATYVAYCFAEVEGYSKFGSYTGNGSADGVFVYTGFRPAYIMIKRTNGVANWVVLDATRDSYNVGGLELFPNTSGAENNNSPEIDFLSNGVKLRWTYSGTNASGGTYIYMAFAESPFKVSLAR